MRTLLSPNPARAKSRSAALRRVVCHHCATPIDLPAAALTATCPACYKPLTLHDLDINTNRFGGDLHTCARLIVRPRTTVNARNAFAGAGLIVLGTLDANVNSAGPVTIGAKGTLRGTLTAPAITIERGGTLSVTDLRIGRASEPAQAAPRATA